jgi:carbon monoxide dehydrogenase subunit G
MKMTGEFSIAAPREAVWQALNDPDVLKLCIPGCDEIVKRSDTEFDAKVTAKVGPVRTKFTGQVTLSDIDPPNGYTITGEGKGGAAGFAKGGAEITLEARDGGTLLRYTVTASVGGKLAQMGSRLIDGVAHKMAEQFFTRFTEQLQPAVAAPPEVAVEAPPVAEPAAAPGGLSPAIWIGGVVVIVVILLLVFAT